MYQFTYHNSAKDYFEMFLYYTYGSIVGVCNVIFTVAMIIVGISLWRNTGVALRLILFTASLIFPVLQPLYIWKKAKRQEASNQSVINLAFLNSGIRIKVDDKEQMIAWKNIKRIARKPTMLILYTDQSHGYLIPYRIMGEQKSEFLRFTALALQQE